MRDRADEELKSKAKKTESKTNADQPEGTDDETRGEEPAKHRKRTRTESEGARKAVVVGASNSNTDDDRTKDQQGVYPGRQ